MKIHKLFKSMEEKQNEFQNNVHPKKLIKRFATTRFKKIRDNSFQTRWLLPVCQWNDLPRAMDNTRRHNPHFIHSMASAAEKPLGRTL